MFLFPTLLVGRKGFIRIESLHIQPHILSSLFMHVGEKKGGGFLYLVFLVFLVFLVLLGLGDTSWKKMLEYVWLEANVLVLIRAECVVFRPH